MVEILEIKFTELQKFFVCGTTKQKTSTSAKVLKSHERYDKLLHKLAKKTHRKTHRKFRIYYKRQIIAQIRQKTQRKTYRQFPVCTYEYIGKLAVSFVNRDIH